MKTKTVRLCIVARDKSTNQVKADVVKMTWRKDVPLKEILQHVVDAIGRIDV